MPLIVRECLYGRHRFDELQRSLGIGRNILTRRLTKLVEAGVVEKRPYSARPVRYEYHLTDMGYDFATVLLAMMPFGEKWLFDGEREPIRLFHRETGQRVRPVLVDDHTGEAIDPRELYAGPGPAFPKDPAIRKEVFTEYFSRKKI